MDLVEEGYRLIRLLPIEERFGLSDQMRRAAVSIPSNIAEGQVRDSGREFLHFLRIAQGSRAELDTQLEISVRLGYVSDEQRFPAKQLCDEIGKMLRTMIRTLEAKNN